MANWSSIHRDTEKEARAAGGDQIERDSADDGVDASSHHERGVQEAHQCPTTDSRRDAGHGAAGRDRRGHRSEGGREKRPLQCDVHDAAAFAEDAPQRRATVGNGHPGGLRDHRPRYDDVERAHAAAPFAEAGITGAPRSH